jgi:hypothetical protein
MVLGAIGVFASLFFAFLVRETVEGQADEPKGSMIATS